jgi:signal transduction histidine kinase
VSHHAEHLSRLHELALELSIAHDIAAASNAIVREVRAALRACFAAVSIAGQYAHALARIRVSRAADRAHAEAELQHAHFHQLIFGTPVPTLVLRGADHVFELGNAAFERLHRRPDLRGRKLRDAFPELAGSGLFEALDRAFTSGQCVALPELPSWFDLRDDPLTQSFFNVSIEPICDAGGRTTGLVMVGADVTDQVRARKAMQEELAARAHSERVKDDFLAMLSHELRNPLAPIKTALELIKLRGDPAAAHEHEIMERQVDHLVRLVDDLLDISRIARGAIELRQDAIDLAKVVGSAIEIASPLLEARRHHLELNLFGQRALVRGDATRLAQVVANLLTNAAKYTEPGGLLEIALAYEAESVVLRVKDNGTGIEPALLGRVFEPFVQGPRAAQGPGGLGVGLTLARNLVALHGGAIEAKSAGVGRGSEFVVRLPALSPEDALVHKAGSSTSALATPAEACRRVLVIDDNADSAELMASVLRAVGHVVAVAYDGAEALTVAPVFGPEVVLIDIELPVMDGYAVGRCLRELPGLGGLRMLAITGYGQARDRDLSARAGFERHLLKPVDFKTILSAVAQIDA